MSTRRKVSTATVRMAGEPIRGEYHGGEYIDLSFASFADSAFEVINVWDYAAGRATIPNSPQAVRRALIEWRDEHEGDALEHDLRNYADVIR